MKFTVKETGETITISKEDILASLPTYVAFKRKTLDNTKIKTIFDNLLKTQYPTGEFSTVAQFDGHWLKFHAYIEVEKNKLEQFDKYFEVECIEGIADFVA